MSTSGHRADADFGLAVSAEDTAVLVIPGPDSVRTASRPSGSGWTQPAKLAGVAGAPRDADVTFTTGEQAVAIWLEIGLKTTIRGAERSAAGVFGGSHAVSAPGEDIVNHSRRFSIEADEEGSALVWWARDVKPSPHAWPLWRMQVRPYDTVAPALPQVTVPIRARVGRTSR